MGVRVRDGEHVSEWTPTEDPIDLGKLGLTGIVEEYDELEVRIKRDAKRRDEIKEAMKLLGKNLRLLVNGREQFQVRQDGQFTSKRFADENPDKAAEYTRRVSVIEFDLDRFKAEEPALYAQYRAKKIVRVKGDD